jgi:hypothetical protein
MKTKFNIFFIIFFLSFKVFAGDDLTGKQLFCNYKDLVIFLDFYSSSKVKLHYLERYNVDYKFGYKHKRKIESYKTTNHFIEIDRDWIRVIRKSLRLEYKNRTGSGQNINQIFNPGYIQKNDVMKEQQSIVCRLLDDDLGDMTTEAVDYINERAEDYNNKIQGKINEQKKKEEEESKKVNKI